MNEEDKKYDEVDDIVPSVETETEAAIEDVNIEADPNTTSNAVAVTTNTVQNESEEIGENNNDASNNSSLQNIILTI